MVSVYWAVLFLFLGSFLNVLAIRTLEGTSVWNPRYSHCPACTRRLTWRDLVPIFSWLILRGKCRTCQQPISWLYPAGELITALCLTFVVLHRELTGETLVNVFLFAILITVTLTDVRKKLIPNRILLPSLAVLLIIRLFWHPEPLGEYLLGFVVGGGLLTLLALIPNGMGGGDVKLFAFLGLGLGWKLVLLALFFSCVFGSLIGLPLKWSGRLKPRQPIPFAPFILLGTLTAWGYGLWLWDAYTRLLFH